MSSCNHTVNNFHGGGQSEANGWSRQGGFSKSRALKSAPNHLDFELSSQVPAPGAQGTREGADLPGTP